MLRCAQQDATLSFALTIQTPLLSLALDFFCARDLVKTKDLFR